MKWNKKIIGFGTALSVFFLSLFASFCISTDTYAVDDYTYTLSASNFGSVNLCYNNNSSVGRNCSDYHYLIISNNFSSSYTPAQANQRYLIGYTAYTSAGSYFNNSYVYPMKSLIVELDSSITRIMSPYNPGNYDYLPSGWEFYFTLTESLPSSGSSCPEPPSGTYEVTENGTYDISQYEYVDVDIPETIVYGDYHNDLVNIYHAIVMCGGVVMVLYFFYCIYRLIIKNTGGM